jgi:hypothetical protein
MSSAQDGDPRWHAALAYALLGPPVRDLTEPRVPSAPRLLADLGGPDTVRRAVIAARDSRIWPYEVPAELTEGLGAAQYAAAWTSVLSALGPLTRNARPVAADRPLTAEERRLLADRPPHHGG